MKPISLSPLFKLIGLAGLALSALLLPSNATESAHPLKPLLWKVEGNGLLKPSYLFGTIHLGGAPVTNLHPAAQKAFDSADSVYTELPMDTASQMAIMPLIIRKDGKTLNESIGKDIAARLDAELKRINPALNSAPFQSLATWMVGITVQTLPIQLKGEKPLDLLIWENSVAAGKHTAGLETADSQVNCFAILTEAEQVILLDETLRIIQEDRAAGRDPIKDLIAAYVSGEPTQIANEMNRQLEEMAQSEHKAIGEKLMKAILTDRDVSMAQTIHKRLNGEPNRIHFFAVGAAHLCMEVGIRSHLQQRGYTITRIEK
jgi:uncharacterized protein YbaP (TraB family)